MRRRLESLLKPSSVLIVLTGDEVRIRLEVPGEPSLYLSGDTVLTSTVSEFVARHRPQICVVPAGGARFDMGSDIIMGIDEVIELTRLSIGTVVANHLEALSHCPVTRAALALAARNAGVESRLHIPLDGEVLHLPLTRLHDLEGLADKRHGLVDRAAYPLTFAQEEFPMSLAPPGKR
jgi:L-ascorbate metabolism protein UlaG (beta-lactamase superfamily)